MTEEINNGVLLEFLKEEYCFNPERTQIKYISTGEDGAYYIVSFNNKRYFLKIYTVGEIFSKSKEELKIINDFLHDLRNKHYFTNSHVPKMNRSNSPVSALNKRPVVMWEFLEGENPKKLSKKENIELGKILANLEKINKNNFKKVKTDKLDFLFENKIFNIIKQLEKSNFKKNTSKDKLKKLFLEKTNKLFILGILPYLISESEYIKSRRKDYVITHGDLHKGNILKNKNGFYIIDWEHLQLALPERDLMWFRVKNKDKLDIDKDFYNSYIKLKCKDKCKDKFNLDKRALKFYILKKGLDELVFFSTSILSGERPEKECDKKIKFMKEQLEILKKLSC